MNKETKDRTKLIMTVFLIVLIGAMLGWVYEMLFYRIDTGAFIKRGQGIGPWLPIYGTGILALVIITYGRKLSLPIVFGLSTIGSGCIEFVVGWVLFHFGNGLRLWDYNVEIWNWGNIGGYVCLRSVLFFGIFGTFFYYIVIPKMFAWTAKLKQSTLTAITVPLMGIVFLDLVVGYWKLVLSLIQ